MEGLIIVYPHFAITESTNKFPKDHSIQKEKVKLALGDGEWWINEKGIT